MTPVPDASTDLALDLVVDIMDSISARRLLAETLESIVAAGRTLLLGADVELRLGTSADDGLADRATAGEVRAVVHEDGAPVGYLVATAAPARPVTTRVVDALAGLASLALTDAAAREHALRSMERVAFDLLHDRLTGLANRAHAVEQLGQWTSGGTTAAVIFADLDRFSAVNDAYGHAVGDEVLRLVAERLSDVTRVDDVVARLSADEFLVIARSDDAHVVDELAARVAAVASFTATVGRWEIPVTASVGSARHVAGESATDVVANAGLAASRAKEGGGGRLVRFDETMRAERTAELALERELRFAIEHDELEVWFQPIVALEPERLEGAEALVRWRHPDRGFLEPASFVDEAVAAGVVADLDRRVLGLALDRLAAWEVAGLLPEGFRVSVNLSADRFADADLTDVVSGELARRGLPPQRLRLEITETAMMRDVERSRRAMDALRDLGVRLSVDDFGTGWSSLAYLTQFPVEYLKIDQRFVAGLCVDADDHAIVEATIGLARALGLGVIAEGVEERPQADELRRLGCGSAQGFLYGRPLPAAEFVAAWFTAPDRARKPQ